MAAETSSMALRMTFWSSKLPYRAVPFLYTPIRARSSAQCLWSLSSKAPFSTLIQPHPVLLATSRLHIGSPAFVRSLRTRNTPRQTQSAKQEEPETEEPETEEGNDGRVTLYHSSAGELVKQAVIATCALVTGYALYTSKDVPSASATQTLPFSTVSGDQQTEPQTLQPPHLPFNLELPVLTNRQMSNSSSPIVQLYNHFAISLPSWDAGRYHTILTSAILHNSVWHWGCNMYVATSFIPSLFSIFGTGPSLAIMLLSQFGTAGASLYWKMLGRARAPPITLDSSELPSNDEVWKDAGEERKRRKWLRDATLLGQAPSEENARKGTWRNQSCGFSGVLMGVIAALAIRIPMAGVSALGFIPLRTWHLAVSSGLVSWFFIDAGFFDHAGHLGGVLGGLVGGLIFRRAGLGPVTRAAARAAMRSGGRRLGP